VLSVQDFDLSLSMRGIKVVGKVKKEKREKRKRSGRIKKEQEASKE